MDCIVPWVTKSQTRLSTHAEITYLYCTLAQLSLYLYVIIEAYLTLIKGLDILELSKF